MWIWRKIKSGLFRFVPQHVNDPFGLVSRMLASGNRAALFTLCLTGLGVVLSPFDWMLQYFERRMVSGKTGRSAGPHIFICGPARSGTTLVYQVLASNLPVVYARNFTVLFSRSPILASKYLTRNFRERRRQSYVNYYGKTAGMQGPSEANHLWNQWVESDESGFRTRMDSAGAEKMAGFFNSFSNQSGLATLSKNNNANAFADVITDHLDNAFFICLRRDKRYLAQSLVKAREVINGDIQQSYGVTASDTALDADPVAQVIGQIDYLDNLAIEQQKKIGHSQFWIIDYEAFCANPSDLVDRVRREILGQADRQAEDNKIPEIVNNNRITDPIMFEQLEAQLDGRRV